MPVLSLSGQTRPSIYRMVGQICAFAYRQSTTLKVVGCLVQSAPSIAVQQYVEHDSIHRPHGQHVQHGAPHKHRVSPAPVTPSTQCHTHIRAHDESRNLFVVVSMTTCSLELELPSSSSESGLVWSGSQLERAGALHHVILRHYHPQVGRKRSLREQR